jgi:transcriptional regulator with XRE-family HTH domain
LDYTCNDIVDYICEMDVGKRFMEVFAYSGLSRLDFADRLKISPAVLSHISSGRNQPSLDLIIAVTKAYPEISVDWILLGTGTMKRRQATGRDEKEPLFPRTEAVAAPPISALRSPMPELVETENEIEKDITNVKLTSVISPEQVQQQKETIMALRIALQMHQQWMEQQLSRLEKQIKGEV